MVGNRLATEKELMITATAYQNPNDRYDKITGKKLALTRALNSYAFQARYDFDQPFLRTLRTYFWAAFWDEFNN